MVRRLFRILDLFLERAFAAVVAVAFSQFFAFIQQYRQRLGGHLAEAQRNYDAVAANTREAAAETRTLLLETLGARVAELQHAYDAIFAAPVLLKPVVFVANVDAEVARGTLADFAPQIPLDLASLFYAAVGLILASVFYRLGANGLFGTRRAARRR